MVLKPANKYQLIRQCHIFKKILIDICQHHPFLYRVKVLQTYIFMEPEIANRKDDTIQIFIFLIYSDARKAFC